MPGSRKSGSSERDGYFQVGRGDHLEGKLSGSGAVVVQGELVGEVQVEGDLLVQAGGSLQGDPARASRVRVEGRAGGTLRARGSLEVAGGGALEGRAQARRLEIAPNASVDAHLVVRR